MFRLINFYKKYNRNKHYTVHVLCLITLIWAIAYMNFEYFIPTFLEGNLQNLAYVGLFLSIPSIVGMLVDLYVGHLQIKASTKLLVLIALFIFLSSGIFILFGAKFTVFIILGILLYGIGYDFFDVTTYTGIFDNSTTKESSTNLALRDVFECVGLMIGAVIAGFVLAKYNTGALFVFMGFSVIAIILTQVLLRKKIVKTKINTTKSRSFYEHLKLSLEVLHKDIKTIFKTKAALICLLLFFVITFFDGLFFGFEPLFAQTLKNNYLSEEILGGLLLATYVAPIIFFEYLFGRLSDKFGKKTFIILGLVFAAFSLFLLGSTTNIPLIFISIFMVSFGAYSISWSALEGFYEDEVKASIGKKMDGESVGVMELFMNTGYILGPIGGGLFTHFFRFQKTFMIVGLMFLIVALISFSFFIITRKHKN